MSLLLNNIDCYHFAVPRISTYDQVVREDVGTVRVVFDRTGGDLSQRSRIDIMTVATAGACICACVCLCVCVCVRVCVCACMKYIGIQLGFLFAEGGAVAGVDFQSLSGISYIWEADQTEPRVNTSRRRGNDAFFDVPIISDNVADSGEYFEVHFTVRTVGFAYPSQVARITILDAQGKLLSQLAPHLTYTISLFPSIQLSPALSLRLHILWMRMEIQ